MIKLTWASQWLQNEALKAWNLRAMNSLHVRRGIHRTLPVWSCPLLTSKCWVQCAFPPLNPYSFLWIQQGLWESTIFWNRRSTAEVQEMEHCLKQLWKKKTTLCFWRACACLVSQACPILCDSVDCMYSSRLLCPWNFPRHGVGCHALLQRIFLNQKSSPHLLSLLHWHQILYHWAQEAYITGINSKSTKMCNVNATSERMQRLY